VCGVEGFGLRVEGFGLRVEGTPAPGRRQLRDWSGPSTRTPKSKTGFRVRVFRVSSHPNLKQDSGFGFHRGSRGWGRAASIQNRRRDLSSIRFLGIWMLLVLFFFALYDMVFWLLGLGKRKHHNLCDVLGGRHRLLDHFRRDILPAEIWFRVLGFRV
jgi:hypothetical protein